MLERNSHECLDELAQLDLARYCLRSLDHRPDIQLFDRRAHRRIQRRRSRLLMQPGIALFELPDFPDPTPAQVAVPVVSQTAMRGPIDAACGVEPGLDLVS